MSQSTSCRINCHTVLKSKVVKWELESVIGQLLPSARVQERTGELFSGVDSWIGTQVNKEELKNGNRHVAWTYDDRLTRPDQLTLCWSVSWFSTSCVDLRLRNVFISLILVSYSSLSCSLSTSWFYNDWQPTTTGHLQPPTQASFQVLPSFHLNYSPGWTPCRTSFERPLNRSDGRARSAAQHACLIEWNTQVELSCF